MKRMYMLVATVFDHMPLGVGDTLDVTDEDAERWTRLHIAREATEGDPGPDMEPEPETPGGEITIEPEGDEHGADESDAEMADDEASEETDPAAPDADASGDDELGG